MVLSPPSINCESQQLCRFCLCTYLMGYPTCPNTTTRHIFLRGSECLRGINSESQFVNKSFKKGLTLWTASKINLSKILHLIARLISVLIPLLSLLFQPAAAVGGSGYGAPSVGYGAPEESYGAPAPAYGAPGYSRSVSNLQYLERLCFCPMIIRKVSPLLCLVCKSNFK